MLLVLEGTDGSGKTTVGKLIAENYGFEYYATPPEAFRAARTEMDQNATAEDHYVFYREAVYEASKELWDMLSSGKKVVCDRYWLTTYIYHKVMGLEVDPKDFEHIVQPDLTALLMVSPVQQLRRLDVRGLSAGDRRMMSKQEALAREYKRVVATFSKGVLAVSTDELTPSEVAARIMEAVTT